MKKQIISLFLAFALLFNMLVATAIPAFAADFVPLEDEELTENVQQIKEDVTATGYSAEYDLFTGLLDRYYSENEIKMLYSLRSEDFTQILKWLRKYIENGNLNGYSDTSSAEMFMDWERSFILDYFINGIYSQKEESTDAAFFVKDLPDYYWFANEEDLPDTITFSVQVDRAVSKDEVKWVAVGSSKEYFRNYVNEIPYKVTESGLSSELTLSAEDLLNMTAFVSDYTGTYKPDTIAIYAVCGGRISNICYVTVGGEVAIVKGAHYGAVEDGEISLSVNNPGNTDLAYLWSYNTMPVYVSDYDLTMDGNWELSETSAEISLDAENTPGFESISYIRGSLTYTDVEGILHVASAPIMPVLPRSVANSALERHLYTPITCFLRDSDDTYVQPGTDVSYRFFTLGDDAEYSIVWDFADSEDFIESEGQAFHIPTEWATDRTQVYLTARAKAPSGAVYENDIDEVIVMQEGEAYLWENGKPLDTLVLDSQCVVKDNEEFVDVVSIPNSLVLYNGKQFSLNSWRDSLTAYWFVNDIPSYENAEAAGSSSSSYGGMHFSYDLGEQGLTENRDLYYFFRFENSAGDIVYTSSIYTLGLHTEASLAAGEQFFVTSDGVLYSVLSNKTEITVPASVGGIPVRRVNSNAFWYCPNIETVNLPASLESVAGYAFENSMYSVKNIHFSEGISRIEKDAFPNSLETVNFPSTLTSVEDRPDDKIKEATVSLSSPCAFSNSDGYGMTLYAEKIIFAEGITAIGEGAFDWAFAADEIVLPSTLKTLAPRSDWEVEILNLPEGLETIDFGGHLVSNEERIFHDCSTFLNMTELTIPDSVKNLGSLGCLLYIETLNLPDSLPLPACLLAESGILSYTFPEGTTVIPEGFFFRSSLETVVIPEGVTEIGDYAFFGSRITTVVLPSTLKSIGDYAFAETQIETIVLPDRFFSIGKGVFSDCQSLSSVTLPKNLTVLPAYTFRGCSSLNEITLPKGISQIGAFAFSESGLNGTLTLPAGLLSIGTHAFSDTNLSGIVLPENLTQIEAFAFANAPLEQLDIPASVIRIGEHAFAAYTDWGEPSDRIPYTAVKGMEGVKYLGQYAFAYSSLTSFDLPASLKQFHKGLLRGTDITNLDLQSESLTFVGDYAFAETDLVSLVIPDSVTTIGNGICKDCYSLQTAVLPALSYARLPAEIFSGCESLTSVTIPSGIVSIGDYAFNGCRNLDDLVLSDTIKTIGKYAFCGCEALSTVTVPKGLVAVYEYAFAGTPVTSAAFFSDLRLIGDAAFENCASLSSVAFEDGVVSIGSRAFAGCVALTELDIPDSATSVGADFIADSGVERVRLSSSLYAIPRFFGNTVIREVICQSPNLGILSQCTFEGCTSLETCVISSCTEIKARAFYGCESLKSFVAPATVSAIGSDAFYGCSSLTSFLCGGEDSQLQAIYSEAFMGCSSLAYCEMGNHVTLIGFSAYEGCAALEALNLSPALKTIGSCAFRGSGIRSLLIGRYVRDISVGYVDTWSSMERKKSCFYDMPKLEKVVFLDQIIDVLDIEDAFLCDPMLAEVYLPSSVGGMWAANGISPTYSLFYQKTENGEPIYCGINIGAVKSQCDKAPIADDYSVSLLPGYVGTTYIRYGNWETTKDRTDLCYYSIYKPNDKFVVLNFGSDYDDTVDYFSGFGPALQRQHDSFDSSITVPTLGDFMIGMNILSDYSVKVMAGGEDITDKAEITWYINWLEDQPLTEGASLRGFAWTNNLFRYRFTVKVPDTYAFDYEDYASGEFSLVSTDEGKTVIVDLTARSKATVSIHVPDAVKDIATLTVMQTVDGKVRALDVTLTDGTATVEAAKDSNLLVYCTADGYYRYSGGVDGFLFSEGSYDFSFTMTPLPKHSSFRAKFNILDILPDEVADGKIKEKLTELGSFDHISAKVTNRTSGAETTDLSLEYPYVVIENYESFFTKGDELEITLIPDAEAEFYGITATLIPGETDYGSTEGVLNGYAILYFTPALAEDATTGRVIVQTYDLLGNRVGMDTVSSGEMLVRRYKNGAYRLTAFEQNNFIGEMEKLSTFASIGWTEDEYYHSDLFMEAPNGQYVTATVPAAPDASHLLKVKPTVTKNDAEYYQPAQNGTPSRVEDVGGIKVLIPGDPDAVSSERWYWTSDLHFRAELGDFGVKNAELLLSAPTAYEIKGFYRLTDSGYKRLNRTTFERSADGKNTVYTFDASFFETDPTVDLFVSLEATDETPIETLQSVGLFGLTLKCDATLDEEVKTVHIGLGSVSAVNKYLLESTIGIIHAEFVSSKTGIPVEVQAPPFSDIELYADGVLVAAGKTNYTGSAVLKYDAPFAWLFWQYDVYAVISFADTHFTTASHEVTCHVDTVKPVDVKAEISIVDAETGKVIFPTAGDTKNVASVNYDTGKRENVAIRQSLAEGKTYRVIRLFSASFNAVSESDTRNVAILWDYVNRNNMTEEEILWAEFDESTRTYRAETSDSFVYSPAEMLYDLKIPTELGVQWENIGASDYILLPGQFAAMTNRQRGADLDRVSLSASLNASLNEEISDISLFPYFPAAMQADLLETQSIIREFYNDASEVFEKAFGLNADDFTEDDLAMLSKGMVQDTFTPSGELAASLRKQGYNEYPILGQENGLFISKEDGTFEVYDFSDGTHIHYSTTLLWDMILEKCEVKKEQDQVKKLMKAASKAAPARSETDYKAMYPTIFNYDTMVSEKIHSLDEIEKTNYDLYKDIKLSLDKYEKLLSRLDGTMMSFLKFEAKYGKEFYDQYLDGTKMMAGFDFVNGKMGEAVSSILNALDIKVDASNHLIDHFYNEKTGEIILNAGNPALAEGEGSGQVGVLVTELKNLAIDSGTGVVDYSVSKATDYLLTRSYSDVTLSAVERIMKADTLANFKGSVTYTLSYGKPADELAMLLNESAAMKNGLINLKEGQVLERKLIQGTDIYMDVGVKHSFTYKSAKNAGDSMLDIVVDAEKNEISAVYSKIKNAKATGSNIVKGVGKAVEVVALVDTITSMYRDMEGQVQAIDNLLPSCSKIMLSMLEYVEVYQEYSKMLRDAKSDSNDREYFTLLPTADTYTLQRIFENVNVSFDDSVMNGFTFSQIYDGQAFYWAKPETVAKQHYIDPDTGEKVAFVGYFPCNLYGLLGAPVRKEYYDENALYGKQYMEMLKKCVEYAQDSVQALCKLSWEYCGAAWRECNTMLFSGVELLPVVGITGTGGKGIIAAWEAADGLDYLRAQDTVMQKTRILEDFENSLALTRKKIRNSMDGMLTSTEIHGRRYPVTYVNFDTAKERWYDFCRNHWTYTYFFEDEDGTLLGGSMQVALPCFPSGHPLGLSYKVGYEGEVQMPNEKWTNYSYAVDNNGILIGWSLEQYGLHDNEDYIARKITDYATTIKWKTRCLDPQIDPAGYIYEAVLSNRVEGATVKLYTADSTGNEVIWDGTEYGEINPQITEKGGYYSWMTPSGLWKVRVEKEGYLPASSESHPNATEGWLPVPPPQLDINIGLVSTLAPTVESVIGYTDGVTVIFSQYMDIESFVGKITLNVNGESVECVLTFTDREASASDGSVYYGKTLVIKRLDGMPLSGNVTLTVDGAVKNYGGTALGDNYVSSVLSLAPKAAAIKLAQDSYSVAEGGTLKVTGKVSDAFGMPISDAELTLSVRTGTAVLQNVLVYTDEDGFFTFGLKGNESGTSVISLVCDTIEKSVTVHTVESVMTLGISNAISSMPFVIVTLPDGSTNIVSASEKITVPEGATLTFTANNGEVGYTNTVSETEPWWCADYTIVTGALTATETTYRIVAKEADKNYSEVLSLTVEFGEVHVHTYGEWITIKEATETETGLKERTCSDCGGKETAIIPVLEHVHSGTLQSGTSATCTATGVKDYYTCSCGKAFEDAACHTEITDLDAWKAVGGNGCIAPLGHNFSAEYSIDTPADCTRAGERSRHCSRCTEKTDVTEITAIGHEYGDWTVDREPTLSEFGQRHRICVRCSHTETEAIAKLEISKLESESVSLESEIGFEEGVTLRVSQLTDSEMKSVTVTGKKVVAVYDLSLVKDSLTVQPNGKVKVKLLLSESLRSMEGIAVYYIPVSGEPQNMNAAVDGDCIVFEVDHFSRYAVVSDQTSEPPVIDPPDTPDDPIPHVDPDAPKGIPGWIIPVVIAVVVLAAGAIVFLVIRKKKKQ